MDTEISIFGGGGFVGGWYHKLCGGHLHPKNEQTPKTNEILTFVSTVDNYNIWDSPTLDIHTNQIWLINLLENSRRKFGKDFTINFISSWFVYGKEGANPVQEDVVCRPTGFYSITKLAAELMLESYCQSYGIQYRILRLANVLGVGDKKASRKKNAFQYMIETLVRGGTVQLYRDDHTRDFINVRDCVRIIYYIIHQAPVNNIYNIGSGVPQSINDWVNAIQQVYGGEIELVDVPPFHNTVQRRHFWMDVTKAQGWVPPGHAIYSLEDTIRWIAESVKNEN